MSSTGLLATAAIIFAGFAGMNSDNAQPLATDPAPVQLEGLNNVFRVTAQLYSGSAPEDAKAFAALAKLGIKTIISVDGAQPNVAAARKAGLRYVHIPVGYNGVPHERVLQLAKAIKVLPGPFYIHCHHGQHRGPTAAAVAHLCADDQCTVAGALKLLQSAGTDPAYKGLFASVEKLTRPKESEWRNVPLMESERVAGFTQTMVAIDQHFDHLKLARQASWQPPKAHPDVDPPHEALLLLEQFQELRRQPTMMKKPADFQNRLRNAQEAARALEKLLRQAKQDRKVDAKAIDTTFARAAATCTACHAKYRD
jgi:protein tyrosine phosphatase (PTP) superfamily phosphohydrolase (DUF442 family)